jgi:hypothetical protein
MENFEYMTVAGAVKLYPFKESTVRQLILHRKTNGLQHAVRKIGKRVYIRKDLFEKWIEAHIEE